MSLSTLIHSAQHEALHIFRSKFCDAYGVIAIHSTKAGPAIGGCRVSTYNTLEDAIQEACKLSQAMSFKSAIHQLPNGGAKAVVMVPQAGFDRTKLLKELAHWINSLSGAYITSVDSGTTLDDLATLKSVTTHVVGNDSAQLSPSLCTATGIYHCIETALELYAKKTLAEAHIAIQGVGNVGKALCEMLRAAGAQLSVTDTNQSKALEVASLCNAQYIQPEAIYRTPCDVFSPCALGAILNPSTVNLLQTTIICGGANNQLSNQSIAQKLHEKDITYLPDYLVNGGGLIYASGEHLGYSPDEILRGVRAISDKIKTINTHAKKSQKTFAETVNMLALASIQTE